MKVLFCTNTFQNIHHGPAKFANYVLQMNEQYPEHELTILTPDIDSNLVNDYNGKVVRLALNPSFVWQGMISVYRIYPFYKEVAKLNKLVGFDLIVFNNAITGLLSSLKFSNIVGMINDDTSIAVKPNRPNWTREWFRRLVFRYLESKASKLENAIIVNSKYMSSLVSHEYQVSTEFLHVLYKGIDIPEKGFYNEANLSSKSPIRVLFVKSDFVRGGLQDLITALESLSHFDFQLIVVGPTMQFHGKIKSWLGNMHGNVELNLLGPMEQDSVYQLMKTSDIFCVPARKEALGVANLEAMAHMLPVVSTRVGGIPETLDHGKNGWLSLPGSPDDLALQIEHCIINDRDRIHKVNIGFEYVQQNFSKDKMLHNFVKILEKIRLTSAR